MASTVGIAALVAAGAVGCAGARAGAVVSAPSEAPEALFSALLGNVRLKEVVPGRFASTLDVEAMASCSMSWSSTSSRATVVLDLAADGRASGCRGRRYQNSEGPNDEMGEGGSDPVHTTEYVEQQGMRGRWRRDGRSIVVDLDLDPTVCPTRADRTAPRPWRLRCAALEPTPTDAAFPVPVPVIACTWLDPQRRDEPAHGWDAQAGYAMGVMLEGDWMLLGPGAGVRFVNHPLPGEWRSDLQWLPATAP